MLCLQTFKRQSTKKNRSAEEKTLPNSANVAR